MAFANIAGRAGFIIDLDKTAVDTGLPQVEREVQSSMTKAARSTDVLTKATRSYTSEVRAGASARLAELRDIKARSLVAQATAKASDDLTGSYTRLSDRQTVMARTGRDAARSLGRGPGLAGSLGLIGLGAAAGVQALGAASQALRVSADEAGTTEGRFRNLGAELLQGNIVGGLQAVASGALLTNDQLERMSVLAYNNTDALGAMIAKAESAGGVFAKLAEQLKGSDVSARDFRIQDAQSDAGRVTGTQGLRDRLAAQRRRGQFIRDQLEKATPGTAAYTRLNAQLTSAVNERRSIEKQIADAGKKKDTPTTPASRSFGLPVGLANSRIDAQATRGVQDDLVQARKEANYYQGLLKNKKLSNKDKLAIREQWVQALNEGQRIEDGIAADAQAAAEAAANKREEAARKAAAAAERAAAEARRRTQEAAALKKRRNDEAVRLQTAIAATNIRSRQNLVYDPISGFFESTRPDATRPGKKGAKATPTTPQQDFEKLSFEFLQQLQGVTNQGPNVTVNQTFTAPTPDQHRETIYMRRAVESSYQTHGF